MLSTEEAAGRCACNEHEPREHRRPAPAASSLRACRGLGRIGPLGNRRARSNRDNPRTSRPLDRVGQEHPRSLRELRVDQRKLRADRAGSADACAAPSRARVDSRTSSGPSTPTVLQATPAVRGQVPEVILARSSSNDREKVALCKPLRSRGLVCRPEQPPDVVKDAAPIAHKPEPSWR